MLYSTFHEHVRKNPNKLAVVTETESINYADLDRNINITAMNLSILGMVRGQVVIVAIDDPIQYLTLYFALARLGAAIVPLSTSSSEEDIVYFCTECAPDYFFVQEDNQKKYQSACSVLGSGEVVSHTTLPHNLESIFKDARSYDVLLPTGYFEDEDLVIHYNTANSPEDLDRFKGSVQTQSSHVARLLNLASTLELEVTDNTLCIHPITHAFGSEMFALPALVTGQTLFILAPKTCDAEKISDLIQQQKITIFGALPWTYKELIELPIDSKIDLSSLKVAISAAAPLTNELAKQFFNRFGIKLNNSYGMTETSLITINLSNHNSNDLISIGSAMIGVDVKLKDCGADIDGAGELLVCSNGFAERYYSKLLKPLKQNDWIHTGDLVRKGKDGNLHILGRLSQIISVVGGTVLPFEIENALDSISGVKESAVVPLEFNSKIEPVAFVVVQECFSVEDIKSSLKFLLPHHKIPTHIILRNELCKSSTGKISKAKLAIEATELC